AEAYRAERFAAEDAARAALNEGLRAAESAEGTAKDRAVAEALRAALDAGVADEFVINELGYRYLGAGDTAMAIAVFRFNVEAFPDSFNTYDSLEEAYMEAGQRDLAIANYERSLELNPDNEHGRMRPARPGGEEPLRGERRASGAATARFIRSIWRRWTRSCPAMSRVSFRTLSSPRSAWSPTRSHASSGSDRRKRRFSVRSASKSARASSRRTAS